jgi:wyosine [tRNA(Phe)-imidazoG37] synthetase (radical SAM superfamily)
LNVSDSSKAGPDGSHLTDNHSRRWRDNRYLYPVISRRSRGLSLGINLNPNTACNFDCVYCQVDRSDPDHQALVELPILEAELDAMLAAVVSGALFSGERFGGLPADRRSLRDIAFSGDGEPTTCPQFLEAVRLAAELKARHRLADTKIVLITNGSRLDAPEVRRALTVMDANHGEIWAKLDAGTEKRYRLINRTAVPFRRVVDNILSAARIRPVMIQSLWMSVRGQPPPQSEISALVDRLKEITSRGGRIGLVQVYTIARRPAEDYVAPLDKAYLEGIATLIRREAGLEVEIFSASGE